MNDRMVQKYLSAPVPIEQQPPSDGEESDENGANFKLSEKQAAQMLGDVGGSHRGSGDKKKTMQNQTAKL